MKTELAKVFVTSSLGLAAASCGSQGSKGQAGTPGVVPLATLNIDVSIACGSGHIPTCNVTNNENNAIFCSVSMLDFISDTIYNNSLLNPGDTLATSPNILVSSAILCDTLCWNDTGMIQKSPAISGC